MAEHDAKTIDVFIKIMERVAEGDYDADIMSYTTEANAPAVQRLAESMGMMLVKVEAREFQLKLLIEELQDLNVRLERSIMQTVTSMSEALGARDPYTQGHASRVAGYARSLAEEMELDTKEVERIWWAGMLHDIGKIGFSDVMFHNEDHKPTPEMLDEIRRHPQIGAHIVENLEFLGEAMKYVLAHHERIDGTGYPQGLAGDEIPLGARIVAVADVYDALTTDRPYQKGRTREEAMTILQELAGPALDPLLVERFCESVLPAGDGDMV